MSSSLLLTRRFAPLFWCQFFSAFSDNFLKNALVFLILFKIGGSDAESLITLAAAVFIAPYFFLSALGGEMADRYDKALVAQRLKLGEIGVALSRSLGFALHSVPILFIALFLFGVIGSLFGPIKYGILPDHLPLGTARRQRAGRRRDLHRHPARHHRRRPGRQGRRRSGALRRLMHGVRAAVLGLEPVHPADRLRRARPCDRRNIVASTARLLGICATTAACWWGALVTSWFWLVGAVVLSLLPPLVKNVLGGTEEVVTAVLAIFSIAIAVGSGLAAWLAAGRIVLLPTLVGAVLLGLFALDLGWATYGAPLATVPAGVGAGLRLGPRPPRGDRSRRACHRRRPLTSCRPSPRCRPGPAPTAAPAWLPASTCSTPPSWSPAPSWSRCCRLPASRTPTLFILIGVASLRVAVAIGRTMPASALSDFLSIIFRALFRIEVKGLENLHNAGPNVIIALNHVSFLDAGLAMSLLSRKPVFAIDVGIAKRWWVKPFLQVHPRACRSIR